MYYRVLWSWMSDLLAVVSWVPPGPRCAGPPGTAACFLRWKHSPGSAAMLCSARPTSSAPPSPSVQLSWGKHWRNMKGKPKCPFSPNYFHSLNAIAFFTNAFHHLFIFLIKSACHHSTGVHLPFISFTSILYALAALWFSLRTCDR